MAKPILSALFIFLTLAFFSCKNKESEGPLANDAIMVKENPATPVKRAPKKELTPQDIAIIKSVMSRIMNEPQLKKYASYLVTAELGTKLSEESGPYLVFAPTNVALGSLKPEKRTFYASPENRPQLLVMLESYIVNGAMDNETLQKTLSKNGVAKLKTLAGTTLTLRKSAEGISISTSSGTSVKVVGNGIAASNGMVYVVDGLLAD